MKAQWALSRGFVEDHPEDAAFVLERVDSRDAAAFLAECRPSAAASTLQHMDPLAGASCLQQLGVKYAAATLEALPLDVASRLTRRMEQRTRTELLGELSAEFAGRLNRALAYPDHSVGAHMDPDVLSLPLDITVAEAQSRIRRHSKRIRNYVYVVERDQALAGVVNMRHLLLARAKQPLAEILRREVTRIPARARLASVAAQPSWQRFRALPVVDDGGSLVGVLRYETLGESTHARSSTTSPGLMGVCLMLGQLYWTAMAEMLKGLAGPVADGSASEEKQDG